MTIDHNGLDTDYLLNLNGAGIADKRWTSARKQVLIDSRVNSNKLLLKGIKEAEIKIRAFTCASAIGYYGNRGEEILNEESSSGDGFLSKCSRLWEQSAGSLDSSVQKSSIVRIGLVLSSTGGALPKMLLTNKLGVLSYFGNGNQYYSWIHIDDLCRILVESLINGDYDGVINGVSPHPESNKDLMTKIKSELGLHSLIVPAPAFGLRMVLGEMANVVLDSTRVIPKYLLDKGFKFSFDDPGKAVEDLLSKGI
jgi:uncharacterized protein (TIGR01777 family)